MSPGPHATLVGCAAGVALLSAGICLARNPKTTSVRLHAVYGATAAWWLFSMAMVAGAETPGRAQFWARFAQLGVGMLPGIVYHVNVVVAGLSHEHRRGIVVHHALSVLVTIFCLTFPDLLTTPHVYSWGPYPAYSRWGLIPAASLLVVFAEVIVIYRDALRRFAPGTPQHTRARAFHYGNNFAFMAAIDFLPAFGVPIYPFGFAIIAVMYAATVFGSVRYRLIEITPEIAAERILETMPDGMLVADTQGLVRLANDAAVRLLGRNLSDLLDHPLESVTTDGRLLQAFSTVESRSRSAEEVTFTSADGSRHCVIVAGAQVTDGTGTLIGYVWLLNDLTEQRAAEEERNRLERWVRQTQRMESLGVLAGGIAHDFNNILMAILGSAEIAKLKYEDGASIHPELDTIAASAEQAAELTDQLLTYAGRGTTLEGPVDLNALSREMGELLRSAISKKAVIRMELDDHLPLILGDRSQMRQVILNLVTNASDALGDAPGTITLRTLVRAADVAAAEGEPEGGRAAPPGRSVVLEVEDTGAGMDDGTKARMFDPFFTTKFTGRGLGLATVLRIVQAHRGVIHVTSEQGAGSSFEMVWPAFEGVTAEQPSAAAVAPAATARGTALLAEDEATVRGVVGAMLTDLGFEVVEAVDGAEAVAIFCDRPARFTLVVLDLTMPRMNGREACAVIRAVAPDMPVMYISGYTEVSATMQDPRTAFLHKPFKMPTMADKIRQVMSEYA